MRLFPHILFLGAALGALPAARGDEPRREAVTEATAPTDAAARTAERLVAILDYVASDYAVAVDEKGAILDAGEYDEQVRMAGTARAYTIELPAIPPALAHSLEEAVAAKLPPAEIARRCATLRARAIERYPVVTAPALPPSFARGRALYQASCVDCHGPRGIGDGPRAVGLDPKPANLLDEERMAAVTPYRVYCDVTYGIAGTAMPAILNPASDRWSVAFYACAMRHLEALGATGTALAGGAGPGEGAGAGEGVGAGAGSDGARGPAIGLATLASSTDAELSALLAREISDPAARRLALARLRAEAPFAASAASAPAALARRLIAQALDAARAGERGEADRLVLDAYLRGVEEIEAPLRARDAALVTGLEDAVMRLRAAIAATGPDAPALLERRAQELLALLGRAERETDTTPAGAALLGLTAALLVLREGLEAALIIAAILAVVRRVGMAAGARRAIHLGWTGALLAGVVTFALARTVVSSLALSRELVEAFVSLLAAAVLFGTSFWLISKADNRRWLAYVKSRAAVGAASGGAAGLFLVAFLAAYREAFESVLFFEALLGGVPARAAPLALGAAAGALLLAVAVYAIGFLERRLPLGPFFGVSGALLSALAVVLLGHGVHALQSSSLLLPRPVDFLPRVDWLGLYPDVVSVGAQGALLLVTVLATLALRASGDTSDKPRPA